MSETTIGVGGPATPIDPHGEESLNLSAAVGSLWTGSRLLIGLLTFLFGAFAFTFFYLRSLDSHGLWHPSHQQPSVRFGTAAAVAMLLSAVVHQIGIRRLRAGLALDWMVAALRSLGLGLLAIVLEIWELTRLDFFPGSSGFASVFVGWVPVYVVTLIGGVYWLETIVARHARLRGTWADQGGFATSASGEATRMRASLDAFNYFWSYLALMGVVFWFLFYIVG